VKDWAVNRQGDEPKDFWSQSFCWGNVPVPGDTPVSTVRVRFRNDGGKPYARAEAHVAYRLPRTDPTEVTFAWSDDAGEHTAAHVFGGKADDKPWVVPTGKNARTRWVELRAKP
jgi:hypothetical protein